VYCCPTCSHTFPSRCTSTSAVLVIPPQDSWMQLLSTLSHLVCMHICGGACFVMPLSDLSQCCCHWCAT
jgi:hypothetical protein